MGEARRRKRAHGRHADVYVGTYPDIRELMAEIGDAIAMQILVIGAKGDLTEARARDAADEWKRAISKKLDLLVISVDGYDADPRELWMIPEVCAYVCDFARYAGITPEQAIRLIPDDRGAGLLAACGAFGEATRKASLATYRG